MNLNVTFTGSKVDGPCTSKGDRAQDTGAPKDGVKGNKDAVKIGEHYLYII